MSDKSITKNEFSKLQEKIDKRKLYIPEKLLNGRVLFQNNIEQGLIFAPSHIELVKTVNNYLKSTREFSEAFKNIEFSYINSEAFKNINFPCVKIDMSSFKSLSQAVSKSLSPMLKLQNSLSKTFERLIAVPTFRDVTSRPYSFEEIKSSVDNFSDFEKNLDIKNADEEAFQFLFSKFENKTLTKDDIYEFSEAFSNESKEILKNNSEISESKNYIFLLSENYEIAFTFIKLLGFVYVFLMISFPKDFMEIHSAIISKLINACNKGVKIFSSDPANAISNFSGILRDAIMIGGIGSILYRKSKN